MMLYNMDNCDFFVENIVDRIFMGYVVIIYEFILKVLSIVKDEVIIYYYNIVLERLRFEEFFVIFKRIVREYGYEVEKLKELVIKCYVLGVWYVVVDIGVYKR